MNNHLGFTGTRHGMTEYQSSVLRQLLANLRQDGFTHLHHGDSVGADAQAHAIARDLGYVIIAHPPSELSRRAFCLADVVMPMQPDPDRRRRIVAGSRVLVAAPAEMAMQLRSETWETVRLAMRMQKPVRMVWPIAGVAGVDGEAERLVG